MSLREAVAEVLAAGDDWIAWLDGLDDDPPERRLADAIRALAAAVPLGSPPVIPAHDPPPDAPTSTYYDVDTRAAALTPGDTTPLGTHAAALAEDTRPESER